MQRCPVCQKNIPGSAERCPWCGKDLRKGSFSKKLLILFILLLVAVLCFRFLHGLTQATVSANIPTGAVSFIASNSAPLGLLPVAKRGAPTDSLDSLVREINGLLMMRDCAHATPLLEHVLTLRPDVQGEYLLGQCLVEQGMGSKALSHLQKIPSGYSPELQAWLDKALALDREDAEMGQLDSPHFHLWVEGKASTWNASGPLFQALESIYDSLCLSFDHYPAGKIQAVLYQSGRYQRSDLPDWTGALFDGKVRIPYNVLENWPARRATLVHEVAHAFVHDIAQGPVPPWFDEGIAQIFDGAKYDTDHLASLGIAPLAQLSQEFMTHADRTEAERLYLTSLGMCRLLWAVDPYRANAFRDVRDLLQAVGKGASLDSEMDTRYHQSTATLWGKLSESLAKDAATQAK